MTDKPTDDTSGYEGYFAGRAREEFEGDALAGWDRGQRQMAPEEEDRTT